MDPTDIILELRPRDGGEFDFTKIVEDIAGMRPVDLSRCSVHYITSPIDAFMPEFTAHIVKHGITSLISRWLLTEAVVRPGVETSAVESLLQSFVQGISVTTELVIVDPYFLAPTSDTSYASSIEAILQPVLPGLQRLTIVGLPARSDATLLASITHILQATAPTLAVVHNTSNRFHDRFWINPVTKAGFLTGSSLNGLGRKYAIVDYLDDADVIDILTALQDEGLL